MTAQSSQPPATAGPYIRPIYLPADDGVFRVYAGDLLASVEANTQQLAGDVAFRLTPRPQLYGRIAGGQAWLAEMVVGGRRPTLALPANPSLKPPVASALPTRTDDSRPWIDRSIPINNMTVGSLATVERFVIHLNGRLSDHPFPLCATQVEMQGQLPFALPDWTLRLVAVDEYREGEDFPFIIEAIPDALPVTRESVEQLQRRLFVILGFVAGREVGLALTAGLDGSDEVMWATWSTPRIGTGQWRWCPDHLVDDALPDLARGYALLTADTTMEKVVDRAMNLYLVANGTQPVDARIPLACSALELLAWAVLQSRQWITTDAYSKLTAASSLRLLLQWAGIPVEIPSVFTALDARRRSHGQPDWEAPDVLAKIRNDLVHPPKKLTQLEWPTSDEMAEAWRLSMHYLELVILRLLDYKGMYLPRLQLTSRWVTHTETVPWG
ncbi:hypothetical protein J4573_16305 [Actinomadura barringtoniae]|uniref:ApeA N-terminal domain-containing protein n=1 Tax=Actinomadura barringtoniae TaxID=1427535 RepID=A0A939PA00_9ACTN|nr:hypothetical protein [Actinomadura barringtoniae]MBO2448665.1 hypothetical protein [Actinomadura barringtoniae]